jgi:rhodanese-related sulfurtransferase
MGLLAGLIVIALNAGCGGEATIAPEPELAEYSALAPVEAKALLDDDFEIVTIDASDYHIEHRIPGAVTYRARDGSFDQALVELDKGGRYLVYDFTEELTLAAAERMTAAGFREVFSLQGGFVAWMDAGLPVETDFVCDSDE